MADGLRERPSAKMRGLWRDAEQARRVLTEQVNWMRGDDEVTFLCIPCEARYQAVQPGLPTDVRKDDPGRANSNSGETAMSKAEVIRVTNEEYHGLKDSYSHSQMEDFLWDPPLFHGRHVTKKLPRKESTAFDWGTCATRR